MNKKCKNYSNAKLNNNRISLIWNITTICPWKCSICFINAHYVSNYDKIISLNEKLKEKKLAISYNDKVKIVENLDVDNIKIDISGGDPLILTENMNIIKKLSEKFGKVNINVTTTSAGIKSTQYHFIENYIGAIETTYDYPFDSYALRPKQYNSTNIESLAYLAKKGINTSVHIPLTKLNSSETVIKKIFNNLANAGVDEIHLIKFFPIGRGSSKKYVELNEEEYKRTIRLYTKLEKPSFPKITLQTAFISKKNELNSSSINITATGMLHSDPWAYNKNGSPNKNYIIGDLKEQKLSSMLN